MDACLGEVNEPFTNTGLLKRLLKVVILMNIILTITGFSLFILGILASVEVSEIKTENIQPLLDVFTVDSVEAVSRVKTLSIILILIGVALIVVGIGWFIIGLFFQEKFIQSKKYYVILVLILLAMTIAVIALWDPMESKVETYMQSKMVVALKAHFLDDTTTNSNSLSNAWNHMFMELDCCGVDAVVSTTNDFDATSWCTTLGSCQATSSQIPKTCCLNVDKNSYTSAPVGCHASVNSGTYNPKGCYAVLKEKMLCYSSIIIGFVSATIALEIIAVIFALSFLVCNEVRDRSRQATIRPKTSPSHLKRNKNQLNDDKDDAVNS